MHDKFYINPDPDKLRAEMIVVAFEANRHTKKRTVNMPEPDFWSKEFTKNEGVMELNGGPIPKPTKSGSSFLSLAWWTDDNGTKYVRFRGGRNKSIRYEGFKDNPFICVFPEAVFRRDKDGVVCVRCNSCNKTGPFGTMCLDQTMMCVICRDLKDYAKTGFLPAVGRKSSAKKRHRVN